MRISVLIPTFNEAANIQAAIHSAWQAAADQVIVADGGSTDKTTELAMAANAQIIQCLPGRGIQMNRSAEEADGDVLLFLHADCRLSENSLKQIRNALTDHAVHWGGFKQQIEDSRWRFRWMEFGNLMRARLRKLVYGDQGIWIRSSTFSDVGGFPNQPLMEDVVLCDRLRKLPMTVLEGPIHVDPRRWLKNGITRQTIKNWFLFTAFRLGVSPVRLDRIYRDSSAKTENPVDP